MCHVSDRSIFKRGRISSLPLLMTRIKLSQERRKPTFGDVNSTKMSSCYVFLPDRCRMVSDSVGVAMQVHTYIINA